MARTKRPGPRTFAVCVLSATVLVVSVMSPSGPEPTTSATAEEMNTAATLPSGFTETTLASGMSSPTAMAFAPDGRLFVAEQTGALRVIKNGALLATPFTTISVNSSGERGLLGVAFDPSFASNDYIYLYYTTSASPIHNRLSRFTANGDVVVAGSEVVLLDLNNLSSATNHNGGAIHFGLDGKLYVAVGDNANGSNAQSMTNMLGKILRINKDGTIPPDNPFYSSTTGSNRSIWAYGLRNPFTFAFQPGSSRMFINDVGETTWEEINDGIAASNFGWPNTEGETSNPAYRSPLYAYGHGSSTTAGCAITGGTSYNPPAQNFPASYNGKYFFADYCSGWIRQYDPATDTASGFATGISAPVDLQVGPDGALYYLYRGSGGVKRVYYTASQAPSISQHPASITVTIGQPASFSCAATGSTPITFQWHRNGSNISGATATSYQIVSTVLADNGAQFRCIATNSFGSATSNAATLTVTSNTAPTASIITPASGTTYAAGTTVSYSGSGTDTQDGTLPASAFTWQVDFHHDTHTHPFVSATTGATSGSFSIPNSGETATNVWYRIYLTVRDSGGLTHTVYRDIVPRTSLITIQTVRPGLQISLDGQPHTSPYTFGSVHGMQRSIGTSSPQTITAAPWSFQSWSDGGALVHNITTPTFPATYTATFKPQIGVPSGEQISPLPGSSGGEFAPLPQDDAPPAAQGQPPLATADRESRAAHLARTWSLLQRWHAILDAHDQRTWIGETIHTALGRLLRAS